jgi:hypothetical protein
MLENIPLIPVAIGLVHSYVYAHNILQHISLERTLIMSRIAVVQSNSGSNIAENRRQLPVLINDAVNTGAQVTLLPEMCSCMNGAQYTAMADNIATSCWFSAASSMANPEAYTASRVRSALLAFHAQNDKTSKSQCTARYLLIIYFQPRKA